MTYQIADDRQLVFRQQLGLLFHELGLRECFAISPRILIGREFLESVTDSSPADSVRFLHEKRKLRLFSLPNREGYETESQSHAWQHWLTQYKKLILILECQTSNDNGSHLNREIVFDFEVFLSSRRQKDCHVIAVVLALLPVRKNLELKVEVLRFASICFDLKKFICVISQHSCTI